MNDRPAPAVAVLPSGTAAEPSFGIGAAAQRIGVAVATLRSWERRYGIGAHGQTPGGHRRYTATDLTRLEHMCALTSAGVPPAEAAALALAAPSDAPGPRPPRRAGGGAALPLGRSAADTHPAAQGLAKAAMRLDADAVGGLLDEAFAASGVVAAWHDLVVPVLFGMGRKWANTAVAPGAGAHGTKYVEVEHLLAGCVAAALHRAADAAATARGKPDRSPGSSAVGAGVRGVLLACAPGELHTLPLEALAAALAERGVPVRMFGASLPRAALLEAVRRTGPGAVVVWAHTAATADADTVAAVRSLPRARMTTVIPAGPGWNAARGRGGIPAPSSLRDAVRMLTDEI